MLEYTAKKVVPLSIGSPRDDAETQIIEYFCEVSLLIERLSRQYNAELRRARGHRGGFFAPVRRLAAAAGGFILRCAGRCAAALGIKQSLKKTPLYRMLRRQQ